MMSLGLFQKTIFFVLLMFNIFFRMRLFRLGPIKKQMTSMYNNSTLFKSKPWQYTDNAIDVCLSKTFPNAAVRSKNRFAPNHASIQPILTMISNLFHQGWTEGRSFGRRQKLFFLLLLLRWQKLLGRRFGRRFEF